MFKLLQIILTTILVSFYFFPFEFTFLPGINTKMMLAVVGLILLVFVLIKKQDFTMPRFLLVLFVIASIISLMALLSITYNQTEDTSYVTYIISAAVWLSSAFTVCFFIKLVHGSISLQLLFEYLLAVCVFQCAATMLIEFVPDVRFFVDTYVSQNQEYLQKEGRLYGIGASLDMAGSRFSIVLAVLPAIIFRNKESPDVGKLINYFFSFIVITVVGNMISRTTTVGAAIGLIYLFLMLIIPSFKLSYGKSRIFWTVCMVLAVLIPTVVVLYRVFPAFQNLIRFGFEGFFSLAEKGEWDVGSNKTLQSMVVFPETMKTWLIGDGYFLNSRYDVNYLGDATTMGFYMGTDIGYLRFLFYFGVFGLLAMVTMIVYSAKACMELLPEYKAVFLLILAVGLIVWLKVSTDVFLAYALVICLGLMKQKEEEGNEASEELALLSEE